MATVKQSFNSRLRRFRVGDPVSPTDDLSPQSFDTLVAAGYIEPLPAKADEARPKRRRKP